MKHSDVIEIFLIGGTKAKTQNLRIVDNKLFNYDTCIAEHKDNNNMIINMTKYSQSSSTIQNKLLDLAMQQYDGYFEIVKEIPMNAESL